VSDSVPVDPANPSHPGYSERFIHGGIFDRFPNVNCVIHSHAEDVLPYVVSPHVPLKPVYHMAGFLGKQVPVWDIQPMYNTLGTERARRDCLVNNTDLGASLADKFVTASRKSEAEALGSTEKDGAHSHVQSSDQDPGHTVVLMRRHGFTTQAESIKMAVYRAIYTKINAKAQTQAMAIARDWEGQMGVDASGLGLDDELVEGCTAMNERFQ
jgi:ribulose-5-phosphate 4-epimerase/fuculose-1-phosphate aldolase